MVPPMDSVDLHILSILQHDAATPLAAIAEAVSLSPTPCWRRIHKMETAGIITARVALLDPDLLGLALTVFVELESPSHSADWFDSFDRAIDRHDEIVEVYRMAGDIDYMLKVVVPSMADFDRFYRELIAAVPLKNVTSRFCMERIRQRTQLPLALIADRPDIRPRGRR